MRLSLRPYAPADRETCLRIFDSNVPTYFRSHERPDFTQFLDEQESLYFLLDVDGTTVGCGGFAVSRPGSTAALCWGMIASEHHSSGFGEFLLLGRLWEVLQDSSVTSVRLGTCQLTSGFFEQYGFVVQSTRPDAIAEGLDDVEMRLELTAAARELIRQKWEARGGDRLP